MEDLETKAQELFEVYVKDIKDTSKPTGAARIIDDFYREGGNDIGTIFSLHHTMLADIEGKINAARRNTDPWYIASGGLALILGGSFASSKGYDHIGRFLMDMGSLGLALSIGVRIFQRNVAINLSILREYVSRNDHLRTYYFLRNNQSTLSANPYHAK